MSYSPLRLLKLQYSGEGREDVSVSLSQGLNVITGASDTGKSFILETIRFMLGSSAELRRIKEADGYDRAVLSLRSANVQHLFGRALRGAEFWHRPGADGGEETLAPQHKEDDGKSMSVVLLRMIGLAGKRLQVDSNGKTRGVSMRDLVRLTVIDEETIITKRSPVLSGQHKDKTVDSSLFQLLLSGVDSSALVAKTPKKILRAKREAEVEVFDGLEKGVRAKLDELGLAALDVDAETARIDDEIAVFRSQVSASQDQVAKLEAERKTAWDAQKKAESRSIVVKELLTRFELLREQYESDMARLSAIAEADAAFSALPKKRCPLCGAEPPDQAHAAETSAPEGLREACEKELDKLSALNRDLGSTMTQLKAEQSDLAKLIADRKDHANRIAKEIESKLAPRIGEVDQKIRELIAARGRIEQAKALFAQLATYQQRQQALGRAKKPRGKKTSGDEPAPTSEVSTGEAHDFCKEVAALLASFKYPDLEDVSFSEKAQDLVISGKERGSHGKGYRAIAHAAFVIGLMRYCRKKNLPHPGFVVLDSPLLTFRRPDAAGHTDDDELVSDDVKEAFYRTLVASPESEQIIILENEEPPTELRRSMMYEHFSKSHAGRYGLFPKTGSSR
ncbi:MAG: hypothetical protein IT380_09990 [Myxococcales bacterium]|nr:hypothetical protein [Myxococcales bacterium]